MEILYLLIPISVLLVLVVLGVFGWALNDGQLDDLEHEGARILADHDSQIDSYQPSATTAQGQSPGKN